MQPDDLATLVSEMLELEEQLAKVKRRLRKSLGRTAARKANRAKQDRIPAKEQIISALRAAPQRTLTVRDLEKQTQKVAKRTLLWTLSMLTREKGSGVVRIDQGVYQLKQ